MISRERVFAALDHREGDRVSPCRAEPRIDCDRGADCAGRVPGGRGHIDILSDLNDTSRPAQLPRAAS